MKNHKRGFKCSGMYNNISLGRYSDALLSAEVPFGFHRLHANTSNDITHKQKENSTNEEKSIKNKMFTYRVIFLGS